MVKTKIKMMENEFTVESALLAREKGELKNWVIGLLLSEKSYELAEKIKTEEAVAIEMLNFPLAKLKKIQGPEEDESQRQPAHVWEEKVSNFTRELENGFSPAPLIVTDFWNHFEVADGNHRHEALERKGIMNYWTIFFIKHEAGHKYLMDIMKNSQK
jgi:hypothetical protein